VFDNKRSITLQKGEVEVFSTLRLITCAVFSTTFIFIGCATSTKVSETDSAQQQDAQQQDAQQQDRQNVSGEAEGGTRECSPIQCPSFARWDSVTCTCVMNDELYSRTSLPSVVTLEGSCAQTASFTAPPVWVSCENDGGCSRNISDDGGTPCCDSETKVCGSDYGDGCITFLPALYGSIKDVPSACGGDESRPGWLYDNVSLPLIAQNNSFFFFDDQNGRIISYEKDDCQTRKIYEIASSSIYPYIGNSFAATRDIFYLVYEDSPELPNEERYPGDGVFVQGHLIATPLNGEQSYTVDFSQLLNAAIVSVLGPIYAEEEMLYVPVRYWDTADRQPPGHGALIGVPCCGLSPVVLANDLGAMTDFVGMRVVRSDSRIFSFYNYFVYDIGAEFSLTYLDFSSGESRFLFKDAYGSIGMAAAPDGRVYLSNDSNIYTFDPVTCNVKWIVGTDEYVFGISADANNLYWVERYQRLGRAWVFFMPHKNGIKKAIAEIDLSTELIGVNDRYLFLIENKRLVRVPKPN
jgi:hypothetical protein